MKKAIAVLIMTAAGLAAQATGVTGASGRKTVKKAAAAQPLTIPKGAVANGDGSFSWTDKRGLQWRYVNTPFGVIRSQATTTPAPASASLKGVTAFDEGDKVRFERSSPFGPIKWEKNKADLTDDERDLVKKQAAGQNGKQD